MSTDTVVPSLDIFDQSSTSQDVPGGPDDAIGVSADDPNVSLGTDVVIDYDASGNPIYAGDGTQVAWTIKSPDGSTRVETTTTSGGFASLSFPTSTHPGDVYSVSASVVSLVLKGQAYAYQGGDFAAPAIQVVPGKTASITFTPSRPFLPSDGNTAESVVLTAKDAHGNLVADGTTVDWQLAGNATLVFGQNITVKGEAMALIFTGIYNETQRLSATLDGYTDGLDIPTLPVQISLSATNPTITLGTDQTTDVVANITDSAGNPLPDGTPVTWYTQKGTVVVAASKVTGGVARAVLGGQGGSQIPGNGVVTATVGTNVAATSINWVLPASSVSATLDNYVIAGDQTQGGTILVPQAEVGPDGEFTTRPYQYQTVSNGTIQTEYPKSIVVVTIGKPGMSGAGLLLVNGQQGSATVVTDANGKATFQITSTGTLTGNQMIALPITVQIQQTWWNQFWNGVAPVATINIAIQPAQMIAGLQDFASKAAWGVLAGQANSPVEIGADMAFSFIPVIGVWTDFRDMTLELAKLWPGGEDPNWMTFGFALAGVFSEASGPGDLFFDVAKQFSKLGIRVTGALFIGFIGILKAVDLNKLQSYMPLYNKVFSDPSFRKILDGMPSQTDNLLQDTLVDNDRLVKVSTLLGPDQTDYFTKIYANPQLGPKVAQKALSVLDGLTPNQIENFVAAGKIDDVTESIGFGLTSDKVAAYDQWLLDSKQGFTPIPVFEKTDTSVKEAATDEYLAVTRGEKVEPNLLSQEWVGGRAGAQGDRYVNGVKTEYKTTDPGGPQTSDSISNRLSQLALKGKDQAGNIIVDARNQPGLDEVIAGRAAGRAYGMDNKKSGAIVNIRILGPNGLDISFPRL